MDESRKQKQRRRQVEMRKRQKRRLLVEGLILLGIGSLVAIMTTQNRSESIKPYDQTVEADTSLNLELPYDGSIDYLTSEHHESEEGTLIVVNNESPIRSYNEEALVALSDVKVDCYQVKDRTVKVSECIVDPLNAMLTDFTAEKGNHDLIIVSGYRDYEMQEEIRFETLKVQGREHTDRYVAKPDRSEHHTGYAIDFGLHFADGTSGTYTGEGIYNWINENCHKYGFILRYREDKEDKTFIGGETWHFRYVGEPHAALMKQYDYCLEEYMDYLKQFRYYTNPRQGITLENQDGTVDAGIDYSIYYVPAEKEQTSIPIPKTKAYTISGNNQDGYIVTVKL